MDFSEFTFKLMLLFLPGIICSYIVDAFTNHKERTQFQFFVNSYVYGLLAYALYWLAIEVVSIFFCIGDGAVSFLLYFQDKEANISFIEIFYACISAVIIASSVTYMHTHKLHFRFFRWLGITKKFGELDVWGYLMNSDDVNWITVRDLENDLMYDGWIQAFSDNSKEAEVLLGDVRVYRNSSGELLYEVGSQYLSMDRSNIVIEVRKGEQNE
ncbi:MAG TPA: hypothetical protein DEA26_10250 [Oceanospirillales bacterium]|nr:hypothetical protein [Oceanospirillales bacterium]|tara:strand:- start:1618 stop:2256 length:639 start_codon:yes stop_codon:yes gene_type:complete